MTRNHSRRYVLTFADRLEPRVVPSHASAQVAIAATTSSSSAATLQTKLAAAGNQIASAYATFATTIRQQELAAFPSNSLTATPTLATTQASIVSAIYGLTYSVETALNTVPGAASKAAVIGQGIAGGTAGTLFAETIALFNAASAATNNGATVLQDTNKAIFYTAVEGAINSSFQATGVQGYLAAVTGSTVSSLATTNLTAIGGLVNPAYSALGTTLHSAFGQFQATILPGGVLGTGATSATITPLATVLDTGVSTLAQTLTNGLASTPAASASGLLQSQLSGALAGSLTTRFDTLTSAAGIQALSSGYETVNILSNLSLITVAYEAALDASYSSIGIEGYLIGSYGV